MRREYECGNEWRVVTDSDDGSQVECSACGADTFDLTEIGRHLEP